MVCTDPINEQSIKTLLDIYNHDTGKNLQPEDVYWIGVEVDGVKNHHFEVYKRCIHSFFDDDDTHTTMTCVKCGAKSKHGKPGQWLETIIRMNMECEMQHKRIEESVNIKDWQLAYYEQLDKIFFLKQKIAELESGEEYRLMKDRIQRLTDGNLLLKQKIAGLEKQVEDLKKKLIPTGYHDVDKFYKD